MGRLARIGTKKIVFTAEGTVCSMPLTISLLLAVHVQTLKLTKNPDLITRDDKQLGVVLSKKNRKRPLVQTKGHAPLEQEGGGRVGKWDNEYLTFGCTIYFGKKGKPHKKEYKLQIVSVGPLLTTTLVLICA